MKIGIGTDIHLLKEGRKLVLGGIEIPSLKGEEAISDGDVLLHSLVDALLGALGKGDIGELFPPSSKEFIDKESSFFVKETLKILKNERYKIVNVDSVISLEEPKLKDYKEKIKENVANLLEIDKKNVSIKAKTNEKVDAVGKGEAVSATVVVLLEDDYEG